MIVDIPRPARAPTAPPAGARANAPTLVFAVAAAMPAVAGAETPTGDPPEPGDARTSEGQGLAAPEGTAREGAVTLGQVLETAVRRSPALELARIDVEIADARALEAAGIDDWVFSATGQWRSLREEHVEGDAFTTTADDRALLDLELWRDLPTGGRFSLNASGERSETTTFLGFAEEEDESEAVRASVIATLEQPLLAGRGRAAARGDRRRAEIELDAADLEMRADATEIVRELVEIYWELAFADRELAIRESSLELARERRRITEAGVEEGAIAPSELLAVDQVMATRREEIEEAALGVTRRSLELRRTAGIPVGPGAVDVEVHAPLSIPDRELDTAALIERAEAMSPELAALRRRGEGAEIDVEVTENGLLPRLDASFSFGPMGSSSSVSDTAQQIAALDGYEVGATLTYEHALGRRAQRGAHAAAQGRLAQATVGIAETELQVSASVVEAARTAEAARRRVEVTDEAIELAQRNIEAEEARFDLGQATNFDVLERQEELEEARLRHARASIDYLIALTRLEALTGDLLETYGIAMEE